MEKITFTEKEYELVWEWIAKGSKKSDIIIVAPSALEAAAREKLKDILHNHRPRGLMLDEEQCPVCESYNFGSTMLPRKERNRCSCNECHASFTKEWAEDFGKWEYVVNKSGIFPDSAPGFKSEKRHTGVTG